MADRTIDQVGALRTALQFGDLFEGRIGVSGAGFHTAAEHLLAFYSANDRVVDLRDFSGLGSLDGTIGLSSILNTAFTQAYTARYALRLPRGIFGLDAKVSVRAPIISAGSGGPRGGHPSTSAGAVLKNLGINTGAMLEVDTTTSSWIASYFGMEGVTIDGSQSGAYRPVTLFEAVTMARSNTTTTSSSVAAAAVVIPVASISGYVDNARIRIRLTNGLWHYSLVNGTPSGGNITIDDPLPSAASSGAEVNMLSSADPTFFTRNVFRDVAFRYGAVHLDTHGFITNLDNCYMYGIGQAGLLGRLMNAVTIRGGEYVPASTDAIVPDGGWAMDFLGGYVEGGNFSCGTQVHIGGGACIESNNNCNGIRFAEGFQNIGLDNIYLEGFEGSGSDTTYALDIGSVGRRGYSSTPTNVINDSCQAISLRNFNSSGHNPAYIGGVVRLGNIVNVKFDSTVMNNRKLEIGRYCRGVDGPPGGGAGWNYYGSRATVDRSKRLGRRAMNIINNPNGRNGARGWRDIHVNSTAAGDLTWGEETTITRDGISSLRVTRVAASNPSAQHSRLILIPPGDYRTYMGADTANVMRWAVFTGYCYIPATGNYVTGAAFPALGIHYLAGPSSGVEQLPRHFLGYEESGSIYRYYETDRWNRFCVVADMDSVSGTPYFDFGISIEPYTFNGPTYAAPAVNHSVYLSDLCLALDPGSLEDVLQGRWTFDEMAGAQRGGRLVIPAPGYTNFDSENTWLQGDEIMNTLPIAGGPRGWTYTPDGWMPFGEIGL